MKHGSGQLSSILGIFKMDKKYLTVFGIYSLFMFCACGYLALILPVSEWGLKLILVGIMALSGFLFRYILKLLSS